MNDKMLLDAISFRLMSMRARIKDLESEVAKLRMKLVKVESEQKAVLIDKKKS